MYYDFYVYTDEFLDFDKAFEIAKALIGCVDQEHLKGYNFNRYSVEGQDRNPHITVRLDLDNENEIPKVIEKLSEMKNCEMIDDFADNSPSVRPLREYSINHHLAHEASTKCAFKFYEKENQNAKEFESFTIDKVAFLSEFMPLWLKYSGFVFHGVNNVPSSSSTLVEELAEECGAVVKNFGANLITDINIFSERLIHTLMNCICVYGNDELTVLMNIADQFGYSNLQEFLLDLKIQ